MKMYLISDNVDTWTGMRLAGVEGCVVHGKDELQKELDKVMADKEVGIVLLTEGFGRRFPELVNKVKLNRIPLFVEIPTDRNRRKPDFTHPMSMKPWTEIIRYKKEVVVVTTEEKIRTFPEILSGKCESPQRKYAGRIYAGT